MNELSQLIAKYVDNDSTQDALDRVAQINFELMMRHKDGVPGGVMFAAATAAAERVSKMIAGMVIDVAQIVHGWDDEEAAQQEELTYAYITLITADALRDTLVVLQPEDNDEQESG